MGGWIIPVRCGPKRRVAVRGMSIARVFWSERNNFVHVGSGFCPKRYECSWKPPHLFYTSESTLLMSCTAAVCWKMSQAINRYDVKCMYLCILYCDDPGWMRMQLE